MFKKYSVLFFFLFSTSFGFGQTKKIDSLKAQLSKTDLHDTVRIKTYFALGGRFGPYSLDSLKKYTLKAIDLSKLNDNYLLDGAYFYMGLYHSDKGEIDKAKNYYKKAMVLVDSVNDKQKLSKILSNYANLLNETTELDEKIDYFTRALKLKESIGNKLEIGHTQYNFSILYGNTGFDSLAIDYLKRALKNVEDSNQMALKGHILNSLTAFALKNERFEEAESYIEKSEKICEKTGANRLCYNTFIKKGTYLDKLKRFTEAEVAFIQSLEYAKKRKTPDDIMLAYANLGKHYELSGNPKKAILSFKKAQENNTDKTERRISQFAYESWSRAESKVGNYKKSNDYLKKYVKIKDSLNSEQNKKSLANAESKYQSEKKDKEIAEQKLVLADKELALTQSQSKTRTMSILIVSLLSASILLWFLFQQRQKRIQQQLVTIQREQEVRTLESLMEGEEKERFRIAKELHDGVNGDLSAIKFKLSSLLEMNNTVIKEAVTMIDNSCEQVRAISHNLVPPSLRDFNLLEAVEEYCQSMNSIHEPEVHFQHIGDVIGLDKKQEANLFRIVQELVTNSIKHAEASEINIQLSHLENTLQLTVEDNGKGFDSKTIKSDGIGMRNVQSRVDYLNATKDFLSNEKGTSYTITMDTKTSTT